MIHVQLCVLDNIHHTVFNKTAKCTSLHTPKKALKPLSSTLPSTLSSTLPIALDDTPSLLDSTLPSKLSKRSQVHFRVHSQIHSQTHSIPHTHPAWLHAPKEALKMLSSTLPSMQSITLSRGKTLPISLDYMLSCMLLGARSRDGWVAGARYEEAVGRWQEAWGGREVADGGSWNYDIGQ